MKLLIEALPAIAWTALWVAGGWLLALAAFKLRRGEAAMVGVGIGLVTELWLTNALGHFLPLQAAAWIAGVIVAAAGIAIAARFRASLKLSLSPWPWIALLALTLLFWAIGRGLAVFDDYQNLPTVSLIATGDVPPHFALNPSLRFGYHYALLLLAAELMRLGHIFPWSALDLARGLSLALPLILAALWAERITRRKLAGLLTASTLALAGGSRWLLLLVPRPLVDQISAHVSLIGSAASSAPSLSAAIVSNWKIDGGGPLQFPFAFYSGVNQPYVMAFTGIAGSGILILLLLLLTAPRGRHWSAACLHVVLLASLAIANEIAFLLIGLGILIAAAVHAVSGPAPRLPRQLLAWLGIMAGAVVIASVQGGLLTEIASSLVRSQAGLSSYFDTSPMLSWPPSIVSAHFGALSLFNPSQLVSGLLEIGPIVLVTPLLVVWARKSLRLQRWFEVSLIYSSFGAVIALFIQFRGPLFTATPRLMGGWFLASALYAVPLLWTWLKNRSDRWKGAAALAGLVCCLGGLVLFGTELVAIQRPVLSTFITPMDARMSEEYWNRLTPGAKIFDPVVFRAPTVFGRFTQSSPSWYTRYAAWDTLRDAPDPFKIRAAGFDYAYFDSDYWDGLNSTQQASFAAACVHQVAQVDGVHSEQNYTKDFRRLLDVSGCR